jgi:hypothetical protein
MGLGFAAQILEDGVPDQRRANGDRKIFDGEDIVDRNGEGFASSAVDVEFAHEQIRVEKKDDERDLDHGSHKRVMTLAGCGLFRHTVMVSR